jgi:L-fuconolactonase
MSDRTSDSTNGHIPVVDAHVHFWDPAELRYPWLDALPALRRPFLPEDHAAAVEDAPVERLVFVEANPAPGEEAREVAFVERLAAADPRIAGIVAFAELAAPGAARALDALADAPLVKGVRRNIQGEAAGFCLQPAFVDGAREAGRRGLTVDLCATHDQLAEVVELVACCPDTAFVLDHCGKPAVVARNLDPWRERIARLAEHGNVCCKLSGLLTEADPARWTEDDLRPYADFVVERFGAGRLLFGSDWPVLTLAGSWRHWYGFTERLTAAWGAAERRAFYHDNAARVYRL